MTSVRRNRGRVLDHEQRFAVARRLLDQSATVRNVLPANFQPIGAAEILLTILIAEERCAYLCAGDVAQAVGISSAQVNRWFSALRQHGLVEVRDDAVALSGAGFDLVAQLTERVDQAEAQGVELPPD